MKIKRLVSLLEGLCKADPEAQVTFKVVAPDEHAQAQLADPNGEVLNNLDIEAIYTCFGNPGGEDTNGNFMDIVIDMRCRFEYIHNIYDEAEKFNTIYKKVTE